MSVPDYFDRVNPDLLALIPPDAKTVLEIGCGAGALCEAHRRINPGVEWMGIEIEQDAADAAWRPGRANRVLNVDIEGFLELNEKLDESCDVLILGDILEHLRDPWAVLCRLAEECQPGGLVLACIPNVQHWTVIRDLLAGKWTYTDEGLMDRTHLRFFTLDSIREMFKGAGLQIVDIRGRDIGNQGLDEWIGKSGIACTKEMRAYQFIIRALKPSPAIVNPIDPIHIHAVLGEGCCARPRILEPFKMLSTMPGVRCTTQQRGDEHAIWTTGKMAPGIVIQQRFRHINEDPQRCLVELGCVIVAELDDDPDGLQGYGENDYMQLRAVHAVQVSTEALAERVRKYNPNVMVFPNQIAELRAIEAKPSREGIHIFYGAQNRQTDWKPIMPALNRVIDDSGGKLWFHVVHDREFYDALITTQARFHPFLPYDEYRTILRSCDIALLPLEPTPFNECKSDIKFLECAAEGVAVVASSTVYWTPPDGTRDRFLCECAQDWIDSLQTLITRPDARRKNAETAYAYVRDRRMLGQHFRTRLYWYRELLRSRGDLNRQLLERVPALSLCGLAATST